MHFGRFGLLSATLVAVGNRAEVDAKLGEYAAVARWFLALVVLWAASRAWLAISEEAQQEEEEEEDEVIVSEEPPAPLAASAAAPVLPASSSLDEIPALFRHLYKLHAEERPFEAVKELDRLREAHPQELSSVSVSLVHQMLAKIDKQRNEIFKLTALLEDESNWKFRMRHKQVEVYLSTADSTDFKVVCDCPASDLFSIISIIYETDLYKHWVPGVSQSSRWRTSKLEQRLYLRFPLPFPMKDREVLLTGYGDVNPASRGVMIYVQSMMEDAAAVAEAERKLGVPASNSALRCDVIFAGFLIQPSSTGEDSVRITMISRLDLKMPLLPDSMIDYASKFVLAELLAYIRDLSRGMRSKPNDKKYARWMARQRGEDALIYQEIKQRLDGLGQ